VLFSQIWIADYLGSCIYPLEYGVCLQFVGVSNGDIILQLRGVATIGIILEAATTFVFSSKTTQIW